VGVLRFVETIDRTLANMIMSLTLRRYYVIAFLSMFCLSGIAQSLTYTGQVVDSAGDDPLIGAAVTIAGTDIGTVTDVDGSFEIVADPGESLEVTYIGYRTQLLQLGIKTDLLISMEQDEQLIDEVVIIGYGTIKKSDLTGSVATVKNAELQKVPATNALNALQGKVAGLTVSSVGGAPGADPVIRLRGLTTLNSNNPIVVIDGVISDVSAMNAINSTDIESVEVLKDASATAIYGSRGAAGVILVTTKRGAAGENRISISVNQSFESVENPIDVMTGREFATYVNEINPGTYNPDLVPNTDWQSLVYQDFAPLTNASMSVSGGTEKAQYYLGLGYFGQSGLLPKSNLDRLTAKLNSSYKIGKYVKVGFDLSTAVSDQQNPPGVVNTLLRAHPINDPFLADGTTFAEVEGGNPLAAIEFNNSFSKRLRGLGNLYAQVDFTKHLSFKTSLQFDYNNTESKSFTPVFFVAPLQQNDMSALNVGSSINSTIIFENLLSYNREFGRHAFDVVAGYSTQDRENEFLTGSTRNLLREDPEFWYLDAGQDEFEVVNNGSSRSTMLSYLGRINYVLDGKYLATATFRRDGSSNFGRNNRWGNFPSFALGWNVHKEGFYPEDAFVEGLKVRSSWGLTGNERISPLAQYETINSGTNAVFGTGDILYPGATFGSGGNPDLRWEETRQFDIGAEFTMLEGRVLAEFDYYNKQTDDILVNLIPPGTAGLGPFVSLTYNAASVNNSGFEWNVSYRDNVGKWDYAVGFNGSTLRNNVTELGQSIGADSIIIAGDLGNGQQVSRTVVGQPIGFFFGYETDGVFQNPEELAAGPVAFGQTVGDLRFIDQNGDGRINQADRVQIGNSIPRLVYGFNFEVGRGSWSVNADIQGVAGNDIYNGKQAIRFALLNYEDKFNDRWTGEGSTNEHPQASVGGVNFTPSDYFIEDASYIRLRNLTLRYDLTENRLDRYGLNSASIFVRGTNLLTLTRFTGFSPDLGSGNVLDGVIDRGVYPNQRILSVGVDVTL
jgi:TonB-linked SusC/RagA family outer membrane protein